MASYFKAMFDLICNTYICLYQWILPKSWIAKDISEDVVLITGGASGLGRAMAIQYAKLNCNIVLWDVNQAGLDETRQLVEDEYSLIQPKTKNKPEEPPVEPRRCLTYIVDLSDRVQVYDIAKQVKLDLNPVIGSHLQSEERYVSILVNNAGIYHGLYLQDLSDIQIERIFKINVMAHFWTVRAFLPDMIANRRGHIVEIASIGGHWGMMKQVDYCSSKAANVAFEESLSVELSMLGLGDMIHTTCVCPYFFNSNLFTDLNQGFKKAMDAEFVAEQVVMGMRCNYAQVFIPGFLCQAAMWIKPFLARKTVIKLCKSLGMVDAVGEIKGRGDSAILN